MKLKAEVKILDYSGFNEFPFPSKLDGESLKVKNYFMLLPDSAQLKLLNGCKSYGEFYSRVKKEMPAAGTDT